MDKILEMQRKRSALVAEATAILDKADTEKRTLNAEESTKYDGLVAEANRVKADMDRRVAAQGLQAEMAAFTATGGKPEAKSLKEKPFRNFGEQLLAVRQFAIGRGLDRRLETIQNEARAATGLNETIPSEGGFLVQTDFASDLLKDTYDTNEIPNRCRRIPISGPSNSFAMNTIDETSRATGSRLGGLQVYHEAEAASMSGNSSKPKFAKMEMKLEKIMGLCYATEENLADSAQLGAIIASAFPEEMGFVLSDDIFRGDGAGKSLGILSCPALITVAKETGQQADTIVTENILKMWKSRQGRDLVWLYNQELEDQLDTLTLAIGTGGVEMRLFQPPQGNQTYGTIKGAPAIPVEVASGPGDVGDIVLADLNQYLLIDKGGIQTAMSLEVEFLTGQAVFRFTYRVNGQPMKKSKVTPYKRTDTGYYRGPFITLASR
jgi:HK97 family phage major capsid protein